MPTSLPLPTKPLKFVKGFTIDSAISMDLDDALWLEATADGWCLQIHIADVDHTVSQDSYLDTEAERRVETVYAPRMIHPMLPKAISEGSTSLLPHEERRVITTTVKLGQDWEILDVSFKEAVLVSVGRLTYAEAMDLPSSHVLKPQIDGLVCLTSRLMATRKLEGAVFATEIEVDGAMVYVSEWGVINASISRTEVLIAELMILNNHLVASHARRYPNYPFLYRCHTATPGEDATVRALIDVGNTDQLRRELLRYQNAAFYTTDRTQGHFGLNLPAYAHTTSPIRRYADLLNQRVFKALLKGSQAPYTQEAMNAKAELINAYRRTLKEKQAAGYKAVVQEQTKMQLTAPTQDLKKLNVKEFSRVLHAALQGDAVDRVRVEALARLQTKQLTIEDLYRILFEGQDLPLQTAALEVLQDAPESISILTIAPSKKPQRLSNLAFKLETDPTRLPHEASFSLLVTLEMNGVAHSAPAWSNATTKEQAKRFACYRFLQALVYGELVPTEAVPSPLPAIAPTARPTPKTALTPETNWVGIVNEYYQKSGGAITFTIQEVRQQYFVCTCTDGTKTTKGEGSSKKIAKSSAAEKFWRLLQST